MEGFYDYLNLIFSNKFISLSLLLFLMVATYTDIKYLKIYNKFNLSLLFFRIICIFIPYYNLPLSISNIGASVISFSMFLILAMIFMHQMGGDIKFIGAFMLFFNIDYMLVFVSIASVLNLIYLLILKTCFSLKRKELLTENKNRDVNSYFLNLFIRIFLIKMPKDIDLIEMTNKDINKYKLPFAPFFLMSFIITYILYLLK